MPKTSSSADSGAGSPCLHTPGPWQVLPPGKAQSPWIVADAEGGSIADCEPCGPWMPDQVATANARLIAAAPDMLVVLKVLAKNNRYGLSTIILDAIDAAIAKAEAPHAD